MASSSEEQRREESQKECVHRTKAIQFFGRTVPIIIQNENGPCPLLAICNVLFLKNQLNLNPDINEVSQEKLLSLVAERLIDSNSNVKDKDAGYVQNQEQNIADAIDLLPRLTTGIDVNIKFHRIDDFEFTPECAIFDLLDIPLYHGWLVDPQDCETAKAIGPKSYNTLTRELVSLQEVEGKSENKSEEDSVDFAAATAATLGVPSPSLSRAKSFDESPRSTSPRVKKEDAEEEAELSKILKISEMGSPAERSCSVAAVSSEENVANSSSHCFQMISTPTNTMDMSQQRVNEGEVQSESSVLLGSNIPERCNADINSLEVPTPQEKPDIFASVTMEEKCINQPDILSSLNDPAENAVSVVVKDEIQPSLPLEIGSSPKGDNDVQTQQSPASGIPDETNKDNTLKVDLQVQSPSGDGCNEEKYRQSGIENPTVSNVDSESSNGIAHAIDECESFSSSLNGSEPLYEGEECIIDSAVSMAENREPVYEGEVVLAKQADEKTVEACNMTFKNELTPQEGKMITNFLKNSASQLTFHGLFSLQEGLKERELCVFFRNNHFCTMFKFEGNLYLLVTDQGYLNQPNLVWEKLNEVNGDTVFVTSDFKEFKLENQSNGTWDQQNAVSSTADYMASIENAGQDGSNMNSDLQLALALQQQEFEQQPQRPAPTQQAHTTAATPVGPSRMVTGPQRPSARPTPTPPKQDRKSKETCCIM